MNIFTAVRDRLNPPPSPYLHDPAGWVADTTGEHLWTKQVEVLGSLLNHRRTAVPAGHDLGKSFLAGRAACWWIDVHPPGEALVVTTAPTFAQVRYVTWQEINRTHQAARTHAARDLGTTRYRDDVPVVTRDGLPGRINQTEWWVDGNLVGVGRKPSDHETASFQGFHRRHILIIIDEASGLSQQLWEDIERVLTNEGARVLAIGNPDYQGSLWHQVCQPGSGWHVITLDGLDSPNFTDEQVPADVAEVLLSKVWVDELVAKFGEDSPQYEGMVRGRFPAVNVSAVVPWAWCKQCQGPAHTAQLPGLRVPVELGMDVGAGGDETVICERRGPVVGRWWRASTEDADEAIDLAVEAVRQTGATSIKVDATGVGWGIASGPLERRLREAGLACNVHSVVVAEKPDATVPWMLDENRDPIDGRKQFRILRDQLWWMARVAVRNKWWDLTWHPDTKEGCDDSVLEQLSAPEYSTGTRLIEVERKVDTKKRLGRSPDDADALLLAFYEPPVQRMNVSNYRHSGGKRRRRR